jgi:hypothetical protein
MKLKKSFENLLSVCGIENQYVGLGNPESNMLFIGKEAGKESGTINHDGATDLWHKGEFCIRFTPEVGSNVYKKNHTWQKYQQVYDTVAKNISLQKSKENDHEITFIEDVFTTELSNLHAKTSEEAKSLEGFDQNLKNRKEVFWKSQFIKEIPIVLITAFDRKYIETYSGEVCDLFGVELYQEINVGSSKIWVHHANKQENSPKLVIHTRQLTNGASIELMDKISEIIADFMIEHSIKFKN